MGRKAGKQALKDYVVFPALSGPSFVPAAVGGLVANRSATSGRTP